MRIAADRRRFKWSAKTAREALPSFSRRKLNIQSILRKKLTFYPKEFLSKKTILTLKVTEKSKKAVISISKKKLTNAAFSKRRKP